MAYTIRLYRNFSKRRNSTKQPTDSQDDITESCVIKNDTTLYNPIFVVSTTSLVIIHYNYLILSLF